jgi:hypothetical protein
MRSGYPTWRQREWTGLSLSRWCGPRQLVPEVRNALPQRFEVAVVEDDVIGLNHHLECRHLRAKSLPSAFFILIPVSPQSLNHRILWRRHNPEPVHKKAPAGLDKQGCLDGRALMSESTQLRELPRDPAPCGGVHDGVEAFSRMGVGEYDLAQRGPVYCAAGIEHAISKRRDDVAVDRRAGAVGLVCLEVGIDDRAP